MFNASLILLKPEHDRNTRNSRRVDESEDVKNVDKRKGREGT
jgi:hypothetical protein